MKKHVRDNRDGLTGHTAALTASGLAMHVHMEEQGETQTQIYMAMLAFMFAHGHPSPNLSSIWLASDRGYWNWPLILWSMALGAHILGTAMRSHWYPFTWNQKLRENDSRTKLNPEGRPRVWRKQTIIEGRALTASAFRNGKGSIAATLSTDFNDLHFDLTLRDPKDARFVELGNNEEIGNEERFSKQYENIRKQEGLPNADVLKHLDVVFWTTIQNSPEWFLGRSLSNTSSTVCSLLKPFAKFQEHSDEMWGDIDTIRSSLSVGFIFPAREETLNHNQAAAVGEEEEEEGGDEREPPVEDEFNFDEEEGHGSFATAWFAIVKYKPPDHPHCLLLRRSVTNNPPSNDLHPPAASTLAFLNKFIPQIGINKSYKTESTARKKIVDWIAAPVHLRRFLHLSLAETKKLVKEHMCFLGPRSQTPTPLGSTKEGFISTFFQLEEERRRVQAEAPTVSNSKVKVLSAILDKTMLKRLKGEEQDQCKRGHELERPFLNTFLEDSRSGKTGPLVVDNIYKVGLAVKTSEPHYKDSADAVGVG